MSKTTRSRAGISATEAAKNFGRLIDRVREARTTYVVERGGRPVASIAPVERDVFTLRELKALVAEAGPAPADYLEATARAAKRHNRPRVRRNPWAR